MVREVLAADITVLTLLCAQLQASAERSANVPGRDTSVNISNNFLEASAFSDVVAKQQAYESHTHAAIATPALLEPPVSY